MLEIYDWVDVAFYHATPGAPFIFAVSNPDHCSLVYVPYTRTSCEVNVVHLTGLRYVKGNNGSAGPFLTFGNMDDAGFKLTLVQ